MKIICDYELNDRQIGFKIFLNITPTVTNWTADNKQFSLIFEENPLADFVELPDDGRAQDELWYSNILCGIIRGSLEMVCTRSLFQSSTLNMYFFVTCQPYVSYILSEFESGFVRLFASCRKLLAYPL